MFTNADIFLENLSRGKSWPALCGPGSIAFFGFKAQGWIHTQRVIFMLKCFHLFLSYVHILPIQKYLSRYHMPDRKKALFCFSAAWAGFWEMKNSANGTNMVSELLLALIRLWREFRAILMRVLKLNYLRFCERESKSCFEVLRACCRRLAVAKTLFGNGHVL